MGFDAQIEKNRSDFTIPETDMDKFLPSPEERDLEYVLDHEGFGYTPTPDPENSGELSPEEVQKLSPFM